MSNAERSSSLWRVVLDTNILVSAFLFGGVPGAILQAAEAERFTPLVSAPLKNELEEVLAEKFSFPEEMIEAACGRLWQICEWIDPKIHLDICIDEDDNRVLECAMEGHAECIVSGDRDLLRLPPIPALSILPPRAFLDRLQTAGKT